MYQNYEYSYFLEKSHAVTTPRYKDKFTSFFEKGMHGEKKVQKVRKNFSKNRYVQKSLKTLKNNSK